MKKTHQLLNLFFFFISVVANSQQLFSDQQSENTYIYQITNEQTLQLFKATPSSLSEAHFTRLVDSFPSDQDYTKQLPQGHYIQTSANKNLQEIAYTNVQNFDVFVLNNAQDLMIQVYNTSGKLLTNASVHVGNKKIKFDEERQAYFEKKSNAKGILSVQQGDFIGYYQLFRTRNSSFLSRSATSLAYQYPTKYVWMPIEFVAMLPVDGVRSIKRDRPVGKINMVDDAITWMVCLLNEDHDRCDYRSRRKTKNHQFAYFVLNKPKHRPGDTLKGKVFVWDHKARPLTEKLQLELRNTRKKKVNLVRQLEPYRKGAYEFQLVLDDSLELQLDKNYFVSLKTSDNTHIATTTLVYEDYELSKQRLRITSDKQTYNRGEEIVLSLDAKDANENRLQDAKVKLVLKSGRSGFQEEHLLFIPDTLWQKELHLETRKTTKISIPDSIFRPANLYFRVHAQLQSSDFDTSYEQLNLLYLNDSKIIKHTIEGDSIRVDFQENGKNITVDVKLEAEDFFGNAVQISTQTTPFSFPIEAYYSSYLLSAEDVHKKISVASVNEGINAQITKEKDSVFINVSNPKQLFFYYSIFKENKEIERGFDQNLRFAVPNKKDAHYYLSLNYLWAGKNNTRDFVLPVYNKAINIKVDQPTLVYPGQTANIAMEVKDYKGNPVANADVLAYAYNFQFDVPTQNINSYSAMPKQRKLRNSFRANQVGVNTFYQALSIDFWNDLEGLHQKEFYQLSYPKNELYLKELEVPNGPTQFAPFVTDNGKIIPVHIIYVDKKPVYFSDMTNIQPYSFAVEEHPVSIQLRTKNKLISLDSISFKPQHKSIISLDINASNPRFIVEDAPNQLEENELKFLQNYVFAYELRDQSFSYIQNNERIHLLSRKKGYYHNLQFAGPILHKEIQFIKDNEFELTFNFERGYYHQFMPKHLKQRELKQLSLPTFLNNKDIPSYLDVVFTKEQVSVMSQERMNKTRTNSNLVNYPSRTQRGNATLAIEHEGNAVNVLIVPLENEQASRIYSGTKNRFYDLAPGNYRLFILYPDDSYRFLDGLHLQADGTNYLKINSLPKFNGDSFSQSLSEQIEAHILERDFSKEASKRIEKQINNTYTEYNSFFGDYHLFEGTVTDPNNIPLPGVDISIENTNFGTTTDFDGNFQLRVPVAYRNVKFNYLGFKSQAFYIIGNTYENVILEADEEHLDEVVVTAYGGVLSNRAVRLLTSKIMTTNDEMRDEDVGFINNADIIHLLQGQVSGILIGDLELYEDVEYSSLKRSSATTVIRGKSSISSLGNTPLIIINGVPFYGDFKDISPHQIAKISVLKDTNATAIYGNKASNGVILITTYQEEFLVEEEEQQLSEDFITEASEAKSLRSNFNDEAFWLPKLSTNSEGKVEFTVTYPDDVTSWDTHFFVATEKQQTGQIVENVKSFKPVMAQLNIPRFLVEGDSLNGIGKIRNYIKDTVEVESSFLINKQLQFKNTQKLVDFITENLSLVATSADTLEVTYQLLQTQTKYEDGEQLSIPVFKKGMQKTEGEFFVLPKDEVLALSFTDASEEVKLQLNKSLHQLVEEELDFVIRYQHDCNEQLASRLKAELLKHKIYQATGREIKNAKQVYQLIKSLEKNQKQDHLWGWWTSSKTNLWASLQVIEALQLAKKESFQVKVDFEKIRLQLENELFTQEFNSKQIQLLQVLDVLNSEIDFVASTKKMLQQEKLTSLQQFQLWEMLQKHGGEIPWEALDAFQKETMLGNLYFEAKDLQIWHPYNNAVQMSLIAYRMLRQKGDEQQRLEKLRNYLLERRSYKGFANTFEAMSVLATLVEDFSFPPNDEVLIRLKKNDSPWETIPEETSSLTFKSTDKIQLKHNAPLPVYVNFTQSFWEKEPLVKENQFEVTSSLLNKFGDQLAEAKVEAGEGFSIAIEVNALQQADYVMIEVPIPSGCSYASKKQFPMEAHRSYAKDKVYIFVENLSEGKHKFEIELMPRYQGSYTLNPASAKLMYFEQFYGNNELSRIRIE